MVVGFAAFGFVDRTNTNNSACESQNIEEEKEFSDFGINGGIQVNYYNGMVSEFVAGNAGLDLFYNVQGKYNRTNTQQMYAKTITEQELNKAKLVDDLIANYPSSWIQDYRSVEIEINIDGETIKTSSPCNVLTKKQKSLLKSLKTTSGIVIKINYNKKNYNDNIEKRQMNVSMVVTPEVEAEYEGGYKEMITYLKNNSQDEIAAKNFTHLPQPSITFIVNENGETEDVKLIDTSRDREIDQLLVKLVQQMPKWKPAKNEKGDYVKQEFILMIGQDGC